MLKRLWVGLRNAKTFRRCEEPLGIDTESIEIGQKFFRMLDEEHLLFNFSYNQFILGKSHNKRYVYNLPTYQKKMRKCLCATGLLA